MVQRQRLARVLILPRALPVRYPVQVVVTAAEALAVASLVWEEQEAWEVTPVPAGSPVQ